MKRVLCVHGWQDTPENDLFYQMRRVLEERGFQCHAPRFAYADPRVSLDDMLRVIDAARPFTGMIGFSLGARLALHARRDGEKLILLSTAFLSLRNVVKRLPLSALLPVFLGRPTCCHPSFRVLLSPPRLHGDDVLFHAWDDTLIPVSMAVHHASRARARLILLKGGHFFKGDEKRLFSLLRSMLVEWE